MAAVSLEAVESLLITPAELHGILKRPTSQKTRVVCVAAGRDGTLTSFTRCHLANSVFFNLDEIRNTTSSYPVMLPTCRDFAAAMEHLGIRADDTLIVYDMVEAGIYCAPRVAWTLIHFGVRNVRVLNSFRQYVTDDYPHSSAPCPQLTAALPEDATPGYRGYRVADIATTIGFEELRDLVLAGGGEHQVLDSRREECFAGEMVGGGHMPGAINVPMTSLLDDSKNLLGPSELRAALADAGVVDNKPAVLTCNTGVTAAMLWLALQVIGYDVKTRLYDGSWSEWKERAKELGLIVSPGNIL